MLPHKHAAIILSWPLLAPAARGVPVSGRDLRFGPATEAPSVKALRELASDWEREAYRNESAARKAETPREKQAFEVTARARRSCCDELRRLIDTGRMPERG